MTLYQQRVCQAGFWHILENAEGFQSGMRRLSGEFCDKWLGLRQYRGGCLSENGQWPEPGCSLTNDLRLFSLGMRDLHHIAYQSCVKRKNPAGQAGGVKGECDLMKYMPGHIQYRPVPCRWRGAAGAQGCGRRRLNGLKE